MYEGVQAEYSSYINLMKLNSVSATDIGKVNISRNESFKAHEQFIHTD